MLSILKRIGCLILIAIQILVFPFIADAIIETFSRGKFVDMGLFVFVAMCIVRGVYQLVKMFTGLSGVNSQ